MQQGPQGQDTCRLSYALFVRPQVLLDLRGNMHCMSVHVILESKYAAVRFSFIAAAISESIACCYLSAGSDIF